MVEMRRVDGWTQGNVADAPEWLSSVTMKLSFVMGNFEMFVKFSTAARNIPLGMKVTLSYLHQKCLPWLFFVWVFILFYFILFLNKKN